MLVRIRTISRSEPGLHDVRDRREVLLYRAALVAAVLLGVAVRCYHVLRHDFPLNDGGLFYTMARNLQANDYRIPAFTTFNGGEIPFGYPPLAMYLAALADDLTPFGLMTLFRLLPMLATAGTVVAFALLARDLLRSRLAVVAAVLVFAFTPRSFIWPLMGGGLTRSLGLLCAILALWAVHRMYARRDRRYLPLALLLSAATVLSHVETGWFLSFSIAIFWLTFGRYRQSILPSAVLALGTLLLTAPWWAVVIHNHGGLDPFLAAQESGGNAITDGGIRLYVGLSLARVVATSEPWYPLLGTLGLLGAFVTVASRRYYLLGWWIAIIVLDPRAFPTLVSLPVSLLAGIAVAELLVPGLVRFAVNEDAPGRNGGNGHRGSRLPPEFVRVVRSPAGFLLAVLFVFAFVGALVTKPGLAGEGYFLRPLSHGERDVMAWVAEHTDPDARVLVVPRGSWETDKEGEWFPVLAERLSVVTVQGYEWVPGGAFRERQEMYWAAYECGFRTTDCLDQWLRDYPQGEFTHIYVPRFEGVQCCSTLTRSLNQDSRYTRVYEDDGGTIWELKPWRLPGEERDRRTPAN